MVRKSMIAILGDASLPQNSPKLKLAEELGTALITHGYRIMCGGLGGVMEAVARGARRSQEYNDGDIIGILPGFQADEANENIDIPIATGLQYGRNVIIANADAVIAIGGGAGTLSEIALAWSMNRLVIAYKVKGWSGELADRKLDTRERYPEIPDDRIYGVTSADEAIDKLTLIQLYQKRTKGIRRK